MRALLYLPDEKPSIKQVRDADLVLQLRPAGGFRVHKNRYGRGGDVTTEQARALLDVDYKEGESW